VIALIPAAAQADQVEAREAAVEDAERDPVPGQGLVHIAAVEAEMCSPACPPIAEPAHALVGEQGAEAAPGTGCSARS
jgi:hypothetical protein